jgi:hypothetical protein
MKSKQLLQILVALVVLFSPFGSNPSAHASTDALEQLDVTIINRDLIRWDASYGFAAPTIYDNWRFTLTASHRLTMTAERVSEDLVPLLVLVDINGNEILRGTGTLTSELSAGEYSIQVQSQTGLGIYVLAVRDIISDQPTTTIAVSPSTINIDGMALVTVSLENIPVEGYTSVELTCSLDPELLETTNVVVGNLFGIDPVVAINGPHDGHMIVALAGNAGKKAASDGTIIAFNVRGRRSGNLLLECQTRVSTGDSALTPIASTGVNMVIVGPAPTPPIEPATCDRAELMEDVTIPAGTALITGTNFTKTWRLKNMGECTWTTSYQLVFYTGDQMGGPSPVNLPAYVGPGQPIDLSINLTAPSTYGFYRGYWVFRNADGILFGSGPQGNLPWLVDIVAYSPLTPTHTYTPSVTPAEPTASLSPTPEGPTLTPAPGGIIYDFVALAQTATWYSGAGQLPFPGSDGNPNGFAFSVNNPTLESGATSTGPGLLTVPQNVHNGYIQGFYPPFRVQAGDRFRARLGCQGGATNCYAAYRLDYQISADPIRTFWGPFLERYDGQTYTTNVDLSPLAGKDVKFILTVLAAGVATGDRMLWMEPAIHRGSTSPSATPATEGPSSTPSPVQTVSSTLPTTPTEIPQGSGHVTGQVYADKPVIVNMFDMNNNLAASLVPINGVFNHTISTGTYTLIATADGFLSASASVTITEGTITTLPTISLLPGDIDNNNVIDPFDALTVGMNYNSAFPEAADLNRDGIINVLDLEVLARNYRKAGPVPWQG